MHCLDLPISPELCYLYAVTSAAIIPDSSERIFGLLGEVVELTERFRGATH